jgi:Uma2 family endonuclease
MVTAAPLELNYERPDEPDISQIVTEDDTPVDNLPSERQQRLLVETLYTSWSGPPLDEEGAPRPFLAAANVGVFTTPSAPPVVPDVMVSLDVRTREPIWDKRNRTYFIWEFGKAPDLVIELVSNRKGEELGKKRRSYARMGVAYYVVFDPTHQLGEATLQAFERRGNIYTAIEPWFGSLGLGLVLAEGEYENLRAEWLRWRTRDGVLLPTGAEHAALARRATARADDEKTRAESEKTRAEHEKTRAESEKTRADGAEARALRLAERLRALGVDPEADAT